MSFKINTSYLALAILLFVAELFIGLYMHDKLIRPYGGDFLVVIFLYCLFKSFIDNRVTLTAFGVLLFAYVVEISQYFHLINLLGLENSKAARLLLGTFFSFTDILAYTLGILLVMATEKLQVHFKTKH